MRTRELFVVFVAITVLLACFITSSKYHPFLLYFSVYNDYENRK